MNDLSLLTPLRVLDERRVAITELPHHRRRLTIDHEPLRGVTPEQVLAWFQHLGDDMAYDGRRVPRYLAWHPVDHVRWELARPAPTGGAAEGARFRIVESFGGRPEFAIDVTERVEKLDVTGIRLVQRVAGVKVFQLEHVWSRGEDCTHYVSVMDIGARQRWAAPLNRHLTTRVMPVEMGRAWLRHNIEEVGRLELLLPMLVPVG